MKRLTRLIRFGLKMKMFFLVLILPVLLSSCTGFDAQFDMRMSVASGTLEKHDKISAQELHEILTAHFGRVVISLTDSEYTLPDNGKVVQLSDSPYCDPLSGHAARPAGWDCDDFAIAAMVPLRRYAFGTMFVTTANGSRHVLNVFVNHEREVKYWEPQNCQYYSGQFYRPELIFF